MGLPDGYSFHASEERWGYKFSLLNEHCEVVFEGVVHRDREDETERAYAMCEAFLAKGE